MSPEVMLTNFFGADRVYFTCGYTNLRSGIDGLATLVQQQFRLDLCQHLTRQLRTANAADLTDALALQNLFPWNVPVECRGK